MATKKQKEKIYFTIQWTHRLKTSVTKSLLRRIGLVLLAAFILLSVGFGSGALQFTIGTIRCLGWPVQTSNFMASGTLTMPHEEGYNVSFLNEYKFCTKAEAEAAGYHSSVLSEEGRKETEAKQLAREEAAKFSPSKVDYEVFIPVLEGYEATDIRLSEIKNNQHTFMRVKKNGTVIGQIRELRADDSYNICTKDDDPNDAYCTVIGSDPEGREIKRSFTKGIKDWKSTYVGIVINGTGIILSSDDDVEAIKLLSSLRKYGDI